MSDNWTARLSEYLDETLPPAERHALAAHLSGCAECTATLAELRRVVAQAQALEDRPPRADLWPVIAKRIGAGQVVSLEPRRRRLLFTVPQLLAAGIALAVFSAGGAWLALHGRRPAGPVFVAGTAAPPVWLSAMQPNYDRTVAELRGALDESRRSGRLDSTTVRVLERSLATIDTAIAQASRALALDPGNLYLNQHLAETMRRKLDLLRQASGITQRT
ncbi:MAG: hypothetical protein AUG10_04635 [Gemmatimonadetes bacterium 13_1_20CM_2_70_10]|nr:MAG: hypothetical protein AUG10_04635 [Gemmatimonadetes bacterium 13_1_20CM_2_70_10]